MVKNDGASKTPDPLEELTGNVLKESPCSGGGVAGSRRSADPQ